VGNAIYVCSPLGTDGIGVSFQPAVSSIRSWSGRHGLPERKADDRRGQ